MISNLSKRAQPYWKIVERIVEERYRKRLISSPIEKINAQFKDDEEANKEELSRVKAVIHEMILKSTPKGNRHRSRSEKVRRSDTSDVTQHAKVPTRKPKGKKQFYCNR